MCGIFGCLRNKYSNINIINKILIAINLLKNRGYDSCGIYLNNKNHCGLQDLSFKLLIIISIVLITPS